MTRATRACWHRPASRSPSGNTRVYADVALPLYTNARGNQLFANEMWKVNVSYYF